MNEPDFIHDTEIESEHLLPEKWMNSEKKLREKVGKLVILGSTKNLLVFIFNKEIN